MSKYYLFCTYALALLCFSFSAKAGLYLKGSWSYSSSLTKSLSGEWKVVMNKPQYQTSAFFDPSPSLGAGIGYSIGSLAFDVTENIYLKKDISTGTLSDNHANLISSGLKSRMLMANITYYPYRFEIPYFSLMPYITAGIGYAYNHLGSLKKNNISISSHTTDGYACPWTTGIGLEANLRNQFSIQGGYQITDLGNMGHITGDEVFIHPTSHTLIQEFRITLKYDII